MMYAIFTPKKNITGRKRNIITVSVGFENKDTFDHVLQFTLCLVFLLKFVFFFIYLYVPWP